MKRRFLLFLCCAAGALPSAGGEPEKKTVPLVACIEPSVLRTEAARLLPGSKLTVMVPAVENEYGLARLSKEEFAATGLKWEQFVTQAATAAAAHLKTLKPEIHRDAKNVAQYAVLKSESHLTASVVLCPEFFARFREIFGDRLVVLMPDRFTVYVFSRGFTEFQTMGPAILEKYAESVWPCSEEAFEITADGLKCLGAFVIEDGDAAPEKPAAKPAAVKPPAPKAAAPAKRGKKS